MHLLAPRACIKNVLHFVFRWYSPMAKRKPEIRLRSYGIYERWDSQEKALPKIKEFTLDVPAVVDIEFGLSLIHI